LTAAFNDAPPFETSSGTRPEPLARAASRYGLRACFFKQRQKPKAPELYFDAIHHFRDYLYIDDAVRAVLLLGYFPRCRGEVYNLLGCQFISTPDMLSQLIDAAIKVELPYDEARAELIRQNGFTVKVKTLGSRLMPIKKQHLNGAKLTRATGFEPSVEFEEALAKTVRFYRDFFRGLRREE
jgi:nucleoside-diphosphate-sugar epimerase